MKNKECSQLKAMTYEEVEAWFSRQRKELDSLYEECKKEKCTSTFEAYYNLKMALGRKKAELLVENGLV
jgi:hypothetical protein